MSRKKNSSALAHPVATSKWTQIREAERVRYDTSKAQPIRMSWKTAGVYTCPELRHRSMGR